MLNHLELNRPVLSRIDMRIAREHEEKLYRPTAMALVVSPRRNLLTIKSAKSHRWGTPQGGIEPGESAIMGLFRELGEEVGLNPSDAVACRFCYATRLQMPNSRGFALGKSYYIFSVECRTLPELTLQKEEVDEHTWLAPHEIGDFLVGRASLQKLEVILTAIRRAQLV